MGGASLHQGWRPLQGLRPDQERKFTWRMSPTFATGKVRLPNDNKLIRELRLLERRVGRTGKDASTIPEWQRRFRQRRVRRD